jgi:hypothetical protein
VSLRLAELNAQVDASMVRSQRVRRRPLLPTLRLKKPRSQRLSACNTKDGHVLALEVYVPRQCAKATALDACDGISGLRAQRHLAERYAPLCDDEDFASMALTVMLCLMRRSAVSEAEVCAFTVP